MLSHTPIPPVAIVVSRYNDSITSALERGAVRAFTEAGGDVDRLGVFETAGAFELAAISLAAAQSGLYRGVVALGCVIRGHTSHDRYINEAVANGLTNVTLTTGIPVAFGLLTVDTRAQAEERAGGALGNKGAEAMLAVIESIRAIDLIQSKARTDGNSNGSECGCVHRLSIHPNDKTGAGN